MNYEYYKVFYCVGKHKNITKAAAELYSSQPAVTRVIHNLENELGCRLFIRTKQGVEFTHEGELLYSYVSVACRHLIRGEEELSQSFTVNGGVIYIGATVTALNCYLFDILDVYRKHNPYTKLKVVTSSSDKTIGRLKNGEVDLAFVTTPYTPIRSLTIKKVKSFPDVLIAGNKFSELKGKKLSLSVLKDYPFITLNKGMQYREFVDGMFAERGLNVTPDIELDSSDLLVPMVAHDWGIALAPEGMAQTEITRGRVFKLNITETWAERDVYMLSDPTHPQSSAARELLRMIKNKI